jgi:hypothetical protein
MRVSLALLLQHLNSHFLDVLLNVVKHVPDTNRKFCCEENTRYVQACVEGYGIILKDSIAAAEYMSHKRTAVDTRTEVALRVILKLKMCAKLQETTSDTLRCVVELLGAAGYWDPKTCCVLSEDLQRPFPTTGVSFTSSPSTQNVSSDKTTKITKALLVCDEEKLIACRPTRRPEVKYRPDVKRDLSN